MPILADIFAIIVALTIIFITYYKWSFEYWKRKKVWYLEPSIPFGNLTNPFSSTAKHIGTLSKEYYDKIKAEGHKHGGVYLFSKPVYLPTDLDVIKSILTKDFQYFVDRGFYFNEKDPISSDVSSLEGIKWKNLRVKLTPTFSSGKMKALFPIMVECGQELMNLVEEYRSKDLALNVKALMSRFSTDVIGSCAFGLDCKSLQDIDAQFRKFGKKLFQRSPYDSAKNLFALMFPSIARDLGVTITPKDVTKFFRGVLEDTIDYRKRNGISRNDFLQLLIDLTNRKDKGLTMDEVLAQAVMFFGAGFETNTTTLTHCLLELSAHQDVQMNLRDEIDAVLEKHGGKLSYEAMTQMKYLEKVINETLRMYPPGAELKRVCTNDYKIPGTDLVIVKGTRVMVSALGIHHDPEYYEDPLRFDPERFSDENKSKRHPLTFIPFGEGPRHCIGMRFGLMQIKVGLILLVKNFHITLNKSTKYPVAIDPDGAVYGTGDIIWINVKKCRSSGNSLVV